METLELGLFSEHCKFSSDAGAEMTNSKCIAEPSCLKDVGAQYMHQIVCVSPSEAAALGVSALDPVIVRLVNFESDSCTPLPSASPCFVVITVENLPANTAYCYKQGLQQLLVMAERARVCLSCRVALHPVQRVLPAQQITLVPSFVWGAGVSKHLSGGSIQYRALRTGSPVGHPHLITRGSRLYVIGEHHFTVATVTTLAASDQHKHFSLKYGVYKADSRAPVPGAAAPGHDIASSDTSYKQNDLADLNIPQTNTTVQIEPTRHYITMDTKLNFVGADPAEEQGNEDKDLDPFFFETPQLEVLMKMISNCLRLLQSLGAHSSLSVGSGVVLHSSPLVGKQTLTKHAARRLGLPLLQHPELDIHQDGGVAAAFQEAQRRAPCVVLLPYAELCCAEDGEQEEGGGVEDLVQALCCVREQQSGVVLVLACHHPEQISARVRKSLARALYLPLPTKQQREEVTRASLQQLQGYTCQPNTQDFTRDTPVRDAAAAPTKGSLQRVTDKQIMQFAAATEGYTIYELLRMMDSKIARAAVYPRLSGINGRLPSGHLPCAYRHGARSFLPTITWGHIRGYSALKQALKTMVRLYRQAPQHHPLQGLLLYGPPGCSKTMFVRALVTETRFSYFPMMCSTLLSKYVGETEKNLRALVQQAVQSAPSIVFMDELDSLCGERATSGGGGGAPIALLLQLMAECSDASTGLTSVWFVGATNRPQALDQGLLQSRYLSRIVHLGLPDCEARCAMWQHKISSVLCQEPMDAMPLCQATRGFSGAEIEGIYQEVGQKLVWDKLKVLPDPTEAPPDLEFNITQQLLLDGIAQKQPGVPQSLLETIDHFTNSRSSILLAT